MVYRVPTEEKKFHNSLHVAFQHKQLMSFTQEMGDVFVSTNDTNNK